MMVENKNDNVQAGSQDDDDDVVRSKKSHFKADLKVSIDVFKYRIRSS